jgi:predicted GIY-YIG superfamily endonuclease
MENWHFYIARCADDSLYIGVSKNVDKRVARHNHGYGAKWVKQHGEATIVYTEVHASYLEARLRETQVKKWSRIKKENLVCGRKP